MRWEPSDCDVDLNPVKDRGKEGWSRKSLGLQCSSNKFFDTLIWSP